MIQKGFTITTSTTQLAITTKLPKFKGTCPIVMTDLTMGARQ